MLPPTIKCAPIHDRSIIHVKMTNIMIGLLKASRLSAFMDNSARTSAAFPNFLSSYSSLTNAFTTLIADTFS